MLCISATTQHKRLCNGNLTAQRLLILSLISASGHQYWDLRQAGRLTLVQFSSLWCALVFVRRNAFRAIGIGFGQCSFVRHEMSSSNISKTVGPRITKFYRDINTDIVYSHSGYDNIFHLRLEVVREKSKMPPPTDSGGISRERFKLGSPTCLPRTSGPTNLLEMASPGPSGRLQNAIK